MYTIFMQPSKTLLTNSIAVTNRSQTTGDVSNRGTFNSLLQLAPIDIKPFSAHYTEWLLFSRFSAWWSALLEPKFRKTALITELFTWRCSRGHTTLPISAENYETDKKFSRANQQSQFSYYFCKKLYSIELSRFSDARHRWIAWNYAKIAWAYHMRPKIPNQRVANCVNKNTTHYYIHIYRYP